MADVETPDVPIDTPYCEQGDAPASCFVAATDWSMPDAPQETLWTPDGDVRRGVLFMHPPAQATFTPTLPVTPTALAFWMGINPTVWDWMGDGVAYRVAVDGREVFTHALTAEQARQGWQPARVDLGEWAGQTVRLTLTTDPGPHGDGGGDWAGWGDVRVVAGDGVPWAWVRAAWEEGGITAQDLIATGEEARKAERYEEALAWYERAAGVAPNLGTPWYYMGLLSQNQHRWYDALKTYRTAIQLDDFNFVEKSDVYFRLGRIYQWTEGYQNLDEALSLYNASLQLDSFSSTGLKARVFYNRGEIYRWQDRDAYRVIQEYRKALSLYPNYYWAHLQLGYVLYWEYGDLESAEAEIYRAIALQSSEPHYGKLPYRYLGDIYYNAGLIGKAIAAYQSAYSLDPNDEYIQGQIEELKSLKEK
jgi:tetratricopeptide (TPR) repeat protein